MLNILLLTFLSNHLKLESFSGNATTLHIMIESQSYFENFHSLNELFLFSYRYRIKNIYACSLLSTFCSQNHVNCECSVNVLKHDMQFSSRKLVGAIGGYKINLQCFSLFYGRPT